MTWKSERGKKSEAFSPLRKRTKGNLKLRTHVHVHDPLGGEGMRVVNNEANK